MADANNAVTESNEGNNERTETINVANCPPNAPTLSGPTTGTVGQTYNFTASAADPDGDDVKYGFDWGDDTSYTTNYVSSGTSQTVSHSWSEAGVYNVCVIAGDSDVWSEPTCQAINISEGEPPEQEISADFSFCLKQDTTSTVKFTDTSTDSLGTIDSWQWDFGDGETSTAWNPVHTYNEEGVYVATLTVTDNDGATASRSLRIQVIGPADVLLVDDDGGGDYESYFVNALQANGISYQVWDVANDGPVPSLTCLLYTSPSPRDLSTSRMPSSA